MMREVVGGIFSAFMGCTLLWYMLPMLQTEYTFVKQTIDTSDPMISNMITLGDGVYMMIPYVVVIIVGFSILSYATRREPFDV